MALLAHVSSSAISVQLRVHLVRRKARVHRHRRRAGAIISDLHAKVCQGDAGIFARSANPQLGAVAALFIRLFIRFRLKHSFFADAFRCLFRKSRLKPWTKCTHLCICFAELSFIANQTCLETQQTERPSWAWAGACAVFQACSVAIRAFWTEFARGLSLLVLVGSTSTD